MTGHDADDTPAPLAARAVVINLDSRPDRLDAFRTRWEATGWSATVPVTRIPGVVDRHGDPAAGCWRAHLNALTAAAADGPGPVLVFEDDVVFTPGAGQLGGADVFTAAADTLLPPAFTLALPPPHDRAWYLLRLGGLLHAGVTDQPLWTRVVRIGHTHAYIARDPAALAERLRTSVRADVGWALAQHLPGHYRLTHATCGQAAGPSDIGAPRPADVYWNQS